jgi:hypothetical protein
MDKSIYDTPIEKHGGSKYIRTIHPVGGGEPIKIDVYNVIEAFGVTCAARQHAIKKLLCAGLRNKGSQIDDLHGVFDAMWRALELQKQRERAAEMEKRRAAGSIYVCKSCQKEINLDEEWDETAHNGMCRSCFFSEE